MIHAIAETRSFARAAATLEHVLGHGPSAKSLERLAHQVGRELAERLEVPTLDKEAIVAEVAVVSCDGGRIRTRAAGAGPGVHHEAWRETKHASFERMSGTAVAEEDPCPALPATFRRVAHVAQMAEMAEFSGVSADSAAPAEFSPPPPYAGPRRMLRTCLASLARAHDFGAQMAREALRRRFPEALRRVFLGDGQRWNWSIWEQHFPTYTPILDFIHAVSYLYAAAAAWEADGPDRWRRYLEWAEAVWQGRVDDVIAALRHGLTARGVAAEDVPEGHPLRPLVDAARYLANNRARMDYPRYRRAGLPITSAPLESLIKQINHRVKGTEMFWLEPAGAEAILQIRAASLCEDGRLDDYLRRRPGHPFTRRAQLDLAA